MDARPLPVRLSGSVLRVNGGCYNGYGGAGEEGKGKAVTKGKSEVDPTNRKRMSVALNSLMPGGYAVAWTAVATDGHRTQGHYTFTAR